MSDPNEAARLRELQRRAFARPRTPEEEVDAAAAAAELAVLRPPPTPPPISATPPATSSDASDGVDVEDDELDARPWLASALAATRARVQSSSPNERRAVAIGASALVLLSGILALAHAALTAPPPAYAIFDAGPSDWQQTTGQEDPAESVVFQQLRDRGVDLVGAPHAFGDYSTEPRLVVYRQWVSESITEVCGGIVLDGAFFTSAACTSDEAFRRDGLEGAVENGPFRIEFGWAPDGTPRVETVQTGAVTLDEVRALGIPALDALEAAPTPADDLIWNYMPDTIAGPLLLAEVDGVQYVGLLAGDDDTRGPIGGAPSFCLWIGGPESNAGGCASAEDFAANGLVVQGSFGPATSAPVAHWLPSGELVFEEEQ